MSNDNLPKGWVWATLDEISQPPQYGWTTSAKNRGNLHLLRTTDITSGYINWETVPFCEREPTDVEKYLLKDGDIVISRAGSVGYSYLIKEPDPAVFASYLIRFRPIIIDELFLSYFLKSSAYWRAISESKLGIAVQNVNATKLKKISLPIAPLSEQHRIVAKIEELFTKLDAGKEELLQAKARLKRYRQSVLKAAMGGELTEDWRKNHGSDIEPASVLLDRILQERREKWEAEQLEQMIVKGKTPKDDKWKNKYKEPQPPDTSKLPELPEGWMWITIEQLSYKVQYGSSSKCTTDENGIPVFRMGNILDGKLIVNDLKYLPQDHNEFPNLLLETGDILFNRTNSAELVGKTAVYKGLPDPCSFASYLIRVKVTSGIFPDLISYYINSTYGRQWIASVVSQQVGQANVNGTKLQALAVPLPPYLEQEQIISEVEKHLSVADAVEATVDAELKRSDALRQSILKQAFSGKLAPQNPNDEPAEKLLARIKKEKAKREVDQKANSKTKKQFALFEH